MNEKKLTDEKIIKAFEVCYFGNESCSACPYEINDIDCTERRSVKDMFDLFNRQKSEIEQLKNDYIELDLECRKLRAELDKELAEHEEFTKKAKEEIESLKSKSSYKNSWKNKFFKAQEEVERLNQGYDMLNYESARKEEYIETIKKQVDELKAKQVIECHGMLKGCDMVKQTVKETAEKFAERLKSLEEALLDMVVQFCQMDNWGELRHTFMSSEEQAFNVLDITYGEKVSEVYERFNKKWNRPIDEIANELTGDKV